MALNKEKEDQSHQLAQLFKALADESRLAILVLLQEGELCVCDLLVSLHLSQPAVSHHLKILRQAGLVTDQRRGKWVFYRLNKDTLTRANQLWQETILLPSLRAGSGMTRNSCPLCRDSTDQ